VEQKRRAWGALAAPALLVGLAAPVIATAGPASAATTTSSETFSGTITSSLAGGGAQIFNFNCANGGPGYVEGSGEGRTLAKISGKREQGVIHFQIAQNTVPYAFGTRIVTSMILRVEAPLAFSPHTFSITLYCTSDPLQAWRVFG